jgi:preprotein translocase subunit SecG
MPTDLVWLGGILVVVAGVLIFILIQRQKPTEPPHFR